MHNTYDHERNMRGIDETYRKAKETVAGWPANKRERLSAYLKTPAEGTYKAAIVRDADVGDIITTPVTRNPLEQVQIVCRENVMLREKLKGCIDLLEEAFTELCSTQHDDLGKDDDDQTIMIATGWFDTCGYSALHNIADVLIKDGRIKRHPSNDRLYRRMK